MKTGIQRPFTGYLLMGCLLFQAVSGIAGGLGLLMDPSGASMRIPIEWLAGSPFSDYTIPGIVLFAALGVFPLIVFYGLWKGTTWAWAGSVLVGLGLLLWLFVEILTIGYQAQPPLQLVYGILGVVILGLSLLPRVRDHFGAGSLASQKKGRSARRRDTYGAEVDL